MIFVRSGEPVWGGCDTRGWGDASRFCPCCPASCPVHTWYLILSPQCGPCVLTPAVPCHHGSLSSPMGPPWLSAHTGFLLAPRYSCDDAGASHASPVPSCPAHPSLHADPTHPFPSLLLASCPCAPHHLQIPASSRLTTLNCPSLRSFITHHDRPLLYFSFIFHPLSSPHLSSSSSTFSYFLIPLILLHFPQLKSHPHFPPLPCPTFPSCPVLPPLHYLLHFQSPLCSSVSHCVLLCPPLCPTILSSSSSSTSISHCLLVLHHLLISHLPSSFTTHHFAIFILFYLLLSPIPPHSSYCWGWDIGRG